jgi:transposase
MLTRLRGALQAFARGAFHAQDTPPYSPKFRRQIVDLVRAGRDPADLAREFEPTAQAIRKWVVQADRQEGRREEKTGGLSTAEREELARLRRENKQLRVERDILSRAAAWFAREKRPQDAPPEGRTAKPSTEPCRPGLRVHEREPGHVPDRHHGPCSRRVGGWLLRLAAPFPVCPCHCGRSAAEACADHPRQLA